MHQIPDLANDYIDFPMSLSQEMVLALDEWTRLQSLISPSSVTPTALLFRGPLNTDLLEHCLKLVTRRHAALRTYVQPTLTLAPKERQRVLSQTLQYGTDQSTLYRQTVWDEAPVELKAVDLSGSEVAEVTIQRLFQDQLDRRFAEPPLIRAVLLKTHGDEHVLLIVIDHLMSDGWSMQIIRKELRSLYLHFSDNPAHQLKPLPFQFPDYSHWQNQMARTSYFSRSITYWREQWARYGSARIPYSAFPFSTALPTKLCFSFATDHIAIDEVTTSNIHRFVRQTKTTLYIVLAAILFVLLRLYTGQQRIAIWTHLANRRLPGSQHVIGRFFNSHLLGIEISDNESINDVICKIRTAVFTACDHDDLPLELLWRRLNCRPRHMDARILLDITGIDVNISAQTSQGELSIAQTPLPDASSRRFSDLGFYVTPVESELSLSVQYATERFESSGVKEMLRVFGALIAPCIGAPEMLVSELLSRFGGPLRGPSDEHREMSEFIVFESKRIPKYES